MILDLVHSPVLHVLDLHWRIMSTSVQEARARLTSHFPNESAMDPARWAELWDNGDFLPWDRGGPNPALIDALTHRQGLLGTSTISGEMGGLKRKKALVPGCGKGYDVLLLASFGFDSYGLEVSESAVEAAVRERETHGSLYPVRDSSVGSGIVEFVNGDFFASDCMDPMAIKQFDLIYDYTVRRISRSVMVVVRPV